MVVLILLFRIMNMDILYMVLADVMTVGKVADVLIMLVWGV